MLRRKPLGLQEYGASVSLERHPPDKVVDEIRCHSQLDESEEKIQAQTPLLFVRFHGILSFCCSLQGQRYGSVLPGFDNKKKRFAGRCRRMTEGYKILRADVIISSALRAANP